VGAVLGLTRSGKGLAIAGLVLGVIAIVGAVALNDVISTLGT
jgi:hypothetical protein